MARKRVEGSSKKNGRIVCDSCGDYMSLSEIEEGECANCGAPLSESQKGFKTKKHGSWRKK